MPDPKPMSFPERLAYAQRIVKSATYRTDPKLAIRELCEALMEVTVALIEREQAQTPAKSPGS
jgi:hypothetical protein